MTTAATSGAGCKPGGKKATHAAARTVSLGVLPDAATKPKKPPGWGATRMGRWRAIVLITVNLIIAAHIVQWVITGFTVTPVEPSESMYALELGQVNAGFIFFIAALVSTVIFGRFFCGWGCHVVALQDLCAHWMHKLGVRPKPFRTRLLLYVPLLLALYMFVLPTFNRMLLGPALEAAGVGWPGWLSLLVGELRPFPGFDNRLMTEDFWKTFPAWYVAIPFLVVCGFATVYFLGSKGFCTYGCPYGGFFAPLDKISIGRIVVSDACEGCGHCTATCTSNVRVHQEVRDFGMVVDPGCMKCLDCVSVCPNNALSFQFAAPAIFAKPRTEEAKAAAKAPSSTASRRPEYDVSRAAEVVLFIALVVLTLCFRGMFGQVPLLMAVALGGIGAFLLWKLWQLAFEPHSRLQNLQLKHAGRIKRAGWITILIGVPFLAAGVWGGVVRTIAYLGDFEDHKLTLTLERVFAPGYIPSDQHKAIALRAIALKELASSRTEPGNTSGIGWPQGPSTWVRLAWLRAVAGDLPGAERELRRAIDAVTPSDEWVSGLADVMRLQGRSQADIRAMYAGLVEKHPDRHSLRATLATRLTEAGKSSEATVAARHVLGFNARPRPTPQDIAAASSVLLQLGMVDEAVRYLDEWIARTNAAPLHLLKARVLASQNKPAQAVTQAKIILDTADATDAHAGEIIAAANLIAQLGEPDPALTALNRLADTRKIGFHQIRLARAQMLAQLGRGPEAILDARALLETTRLPLPEPGEVASAAELLIAQEQTAAALPLLERWTTRWPQAIFPRVAKARATFFSGKPDDAIKQMQATIQLDPTSPLLWSLLAELLEAAGKTQEAQAAAQKSAQFAGQPSQPAQPR